MNYYVFQVSDLSGYGKQRTALEVFNSLVREHSVWGFGPRTQNRKAIKPGDRALFYLVGSSNQVFVGYATLKSGAYEDKSGAQPDLFLDPETLRIDLEDVVIFDTPKPRRSLTSLEWRPNAGGSSRITEEDFNIVIGAAPNVAGAPQISSEEEELFIFEKYLEDLIVKNWDKVDFGEKLAIFQDEDGNSGQQYATGEVGYIDILARDANDGFVVIELKKGRKDDEVIGQVLRYMGWVRRNLAKAGQDVRGIIVVGDRDAKLEFAVSEVQAKVSVRVYKVSFKLEKY